VSSIRLFTFSPSERGRHRVIFIKEQPSFQGCTINVAFFLILRPEIMTSPWIAERAINDTEREQNDTLLRLRLNRFPVSPRKEPPPLSRAGRSRRFGPAFHSQKLTKVEH
jgi:hypothetical protein